MADQPTTATEPMTPTTAPSPAAKKREAVKNPFIWGTGRRKTSIARVRIRPGQGKFMVNKREVDKYFCVDRDRRTVRVPLLATDSEKSYDVFVNVIGGGVTGQAGAITLGLARALATSNPQFVPKLRELNLLRRDPRKVERKKYGQSGARRRFQFSKR